MKLVCPKHSLASTIVWLAVGSAAAALTQPAQAANSNAEMTTAQPAAMSAAKSLWTTVASTSATVNISTHTIAITAPNNVYAYATRQLNPDSKLARGPFRFSGEIQAPSAADWAPSLFVYWAPNTWLRIGYISAHDTYHVNGPGVYGVICTPEGQTSYRMTTTSSSDWTYGPEYGTLDKTPVSKLRNHVAIVVDQNTIHFQISPDGKNWETVRSMERPAAMASVPAQLMAGKGYFEAGKYPNPQLKNNDADPGPVNKAALRNVKVRPVSPQDLKQAAAPGEHFRDTYGEAELQKSGDPTFDSVASHWPPLLYPRDAIGVADHPEEFAVQPDGVIACWPLELIHPKDHDGRRGWLLVGADKQRYGWGTTVTRSLADGWLPVLTCGYDHDGLRYEQTLAGWSEGMSADKPLVGLVQVTVKNPSDKPAKTRLSFFSEHEQKDLLTWDALAIPAHGEKSVWFEIPFPNGSDKPFTASLSDEGTFRKKVAQVRQSWEKRITGDGMQISVPEKRIMDAWKAWHVWMITDVDKVDGKYQYHDGGGGFYELVYGFSAGQAAELADAVNRPEDARRWLECMLGMGDGNGLFIINFGLPDQGALMNGVIHHYRYTHDKQWLKKVAPTLVKMSRWAKDARAKAMAETPTTSPAYGMIKLRPYCDHPDPGFYLVSDILLATGMQNTASALAEIGMNDDAKWISAEADAYAKDLRKIIKNSVFEVDGQKLLPLFPETRELLRASGWMASDYYSLCITSILERGGDILPADSEYAKIIVDALEKRGGLLMGMARFWGGIDHAYTAGYWHDRLVKGEPEKALLGLYGSMAYGMSRDTFASVEVTFAKDGKNFPTLPHNYSNFQQIRLVRNLLVLDNDEQLVLGAGIARHWLASGQPIEVHNALTPWGKISYKMQMKSGGKAIETSLDGLDTAPGRGIKVVLRHPDEKAPGEINVTGAEVTEKGADYVIIKKTSPHVSIIAQY